MSADHLRFSSRLHLLRQPLELLLIGRSIVVVIDSIDPTDALLRGAAEVTATTRLLFGHIKAKLVLHRLLATDGTRHRLLLCLELLLLTEEGRVVLDGTIEDGT